MGGSAAVNGTVTTAPSVYHLEGGSVQLGGSITPIMRKYGAEWIFIPGGYHGGSVSYGVGRNIATPLNSEIHGTYEQDWILVDFNVVEQMFGISRYETLCGKKPWE